MEVASVLLGVLRLSCMVVLQQQDHSFLQQKKMRAQHS
jgi:hypothetical protein